MMQTVKTYVHRSHRVLRALRAEPGFHTGVRIAGWALSGFVLSAASLGNYPQSFALALVCAASGLGAAVMALGGCLGYWVFWGSAGYPGMLWLGAGLLCALAVGSRPAVRSRSLLRCAMAALIAAATGLGFQVYFHRAVPVGIYLLQVLLAGASTALFIRADQRRDPIARWLIQGIAVLALAQIAPAPWLCLGYIAAALGCAGAFPAAALGGLALDLAQVTTVPMTAVLCLAYFTRLIPVRNRYFTVCAVPAAYLTVMGLCGSWDFNPLLPLLLGGIATLWAHREQPMTHRRGETGIAQVRLELVAGAFRQAQQALLETEPAPMDTQALIARTAERACGGCACRKSCTQRTAAGQMPAALLEKPLLDSTDLPLVCRKPGRLLQELHRTQEQLRALRSDRARQAEYRGAVIQQYQFLGEYLQELSDTLGRRGGTSLPRYAPAVAFAGNREQQENGDRCCCFAGTQGRYYVLLCDGMGTGLGAAEEGKHAAALLKKLLLAGFPAEYALRTLNSLCALRGAAGAATADLVQLHLDTGKALVYKWGAAPSYLLSAAGTEKIGTATPPPGLSASEGREWVQRLSLRRGEILVLCSDGVGGEAARSRCVYAPDVPLGELAARILGEPDDKDDATVAVVRLDPELLRP